MKRTLWNITLASVITLVAYIVLYAIWGAILSELKNSTVKKRFDCIDDNNCIWLFTPIHL